jgi:hypothetical protein
MEQELISKKELLELTGISYGQLYRWKRKNLIPEDWFIRKSTFTGQETFFPRDQMMDRIEKIKNMKEDLSLDDLANMLSPKLTKVTLERKEILKRNIVSQVTLDFYLELKGETEKLAFEKILYLYILEKLFEPGKINFEEGKLLLKLLEEYYPKYKGKSCKVIFLRKLGFSTCCLISSPSKIHFENSLKVVESLNISDLIEELKIKMI